MLKTLSRIMVVAAAMLGGIALAQIVSSPPIMVTVPFPAGGAGDATVRIVGQRMQEKFGQNMVVENRPGANGGIGTKYVIKAKPDGRTLVLATPGQISIAPLLNASVGFEASKDLTPITGLTLQPLFLAVPSSLPVKNLRELLQLEKTSSQKVSFGSSGNGAMSHLLGTIISTAGGGTFVHIPYSGGAPLLNAILSGDIQFAFLAAADAVRFGRSGKVKLLGVTGTSRSPFMPEIATFRELGLEGLEYQFWLGLLGPAELPGAVIDQIQRQVHEVLAEPETRNKLEQLSMVVWPATADQFAATLKGEALSYPKVIKESGLKSE